MRRSLFFLAVFAASAATGAHAQGQGSAQGPTLFEPFDWGPNAAWRRRGSVVRETRRQLLRNGNIGALNAIRGQPFFAPSIRTQGGLATAVTGAFRVPVILVGYKDKPPQYSVTDFQCLLFSRTPAACGLFGPHPYSVTSYYEELSHNRISMDGVVFPTVTMDSIAEFYTDGCRGITVLTPCPDRSGPGGTGNRMAIMLRAALDSISNRPGADTVWGQFDNDGPDGLPNSGDDDGFVDFVTFLQPEVGGECTSNVPVTTGVWSHRFVMSGWPVPGQQAQPFVTKTLRRSGGQPIPGQFIRVNDYTIQSQLGGSTSCLPAEIMGVGTVSHETGHAFGLPDLYDTRGPTQGIGGWGLMGSGNYARPYSPASFDAWSLNDLGWATIDTLGASRTITAGARLLTDTVFYAKLHHLDEYVLIENRQAVLSDTAHMNPLLSSECPMLGFCAKSPGLLVWLISEGKVQGGRAANTVNFGLPHGVALMQADGRNDLRASGLRNRGDRGDAFPGSTGNTKLSLLTNPVARDNLGGYFGFILDQIEQQGGGNMRFRFTRREPSVIFAQTGAQVRVNGTLWDRYEEVVPPGDQLQVSVEQFQLLDGGKTRAQFLAWSNSGPRDQTLTSHPTKPDTLSASFSLEHRLLLVPVLGGVTTSSVAGNLAQGVFLAAGSNVTLTASAAPGFVFAGWRGDTVATNPTLQLSMNRGYDIEARFVSTVPVVDADAIADVLGTPRLSEGQRAFLDELGNRNGMLDVGDILAMLRRSGQPVPPALLKAAVPPPLQRKDPR